MSVDAYWKSLLPPLKMMSATSQSHSTDSSYAFFISPNLRFVNVTCAHSPTHLHSSSPVSFPSIITLLSSRCNSRTREQLVISYIIQECSDCNHINIRTMRTLTVPGGCAHPQFAGWRSSCGPFDFLDSAWSCCVLESSRTRTQQEIPTTSSRFRVRVNLALSRSLIAIILFIAGEPSN